jgi:hypothetical protein
MVSRGIGLVYFISFASLVRQVVPIAGERGITPIRESLNAARRDFRAPHRYFYFPSLFWLSQKDGFVAAVPWIGLLAAASTVLGGPHVPVAFLLAYLAYLSLDRGVYLVYPWDSLLFEAGIWALFLPTTHLLPDVTATAAPLPSVVWVYRLLVFRVMLGFGKHKFVGSTKQDKGFLKPFFVNQPLPTRLAFVVHGLPLWVHQLALFVMFLSEVPVPFTVFFPGLPSVIGAVSTIGLMLGIWATGSYGYFNIAVIVLSVSWLDTTTARALHVPSFDPTNAAWWVDALAWTHTVLALFAFSFNTFCSHTWMNWAWWRRFGPLAWPIFLVRWLHPFRFVHAYGVFPPRTPPPIKLSPVLEATWDGRDWHALEYHFYPTGESSRPKLCAPHHARFDQAAVYEPVGLNESSIIRNIIGRWDPYGHGGTPAAQRLMRRVLDGTLTTSLFFDRSLERERGRPSAVRVRTYMLEPTSAEERRRAGQVWTKTLVGPHFPPMTVLGDPFERPLPPPELWNLDDLVWLSRSRVGELMRRAANGGDSHALVTELTDELDSAHVVAFWQDFVPHATDANRDDWTQVRALVDRLRTRYDRPMLYRFERLAGRYAAFLFARLEPLFTDGGARALFGKATSSLDVKSAHHLRLLAFHIVSLGRATFDAVMRDPATAKAHLPSFSLASGYFFQAILRYEAMVFQSQKFRLLKTYVEHEGRAEPSEKERLNRDKLEAVARRFFGVLDAMDFFRAQFTSAHDVLDTPEAWPRFELSKTGEVRRL